MSPRPRFRRLAAGVRERILTMAADEFGAHGFERASLNRIIEGSGVSKGAMYYYFDDKIDLYTTVIDYAVKVYLEHAGELHPSDLDAETFWPRIEEWMRESMAVSAGHPWIVGLARHVVTAQVPTGPAMRIWELWTSVTKAFLERGQELGLVRDDLPYDLLVGVVVGVGNAVDRWMLERWDDVPVEDLQALVPTLTDLFRRLVEPATEREP